MILSRLFTAEIGEGDVHVEESQPCNEKSGGVIYHDIIEAIHKEIQLKSQEIGLFDVGEGFTCEGIVHLDSRESHYRVKTELVASVGPVFAVKICTINRCIAGIAVRQTNEITLNGSDDGNCNLKQTGSDRLEDSPVVNGKSATEPKDPSPTFNHVDRSESFTSEMKDSTNLEGPKKNATLNKMEEVFRGPTSYSSSGASGFGFAGHKKKGDDVLNLYLCRLCVYCCVKRGELKKHHTAVHLDGKPYGCPHCPYRSTHKSTLRSHIMSRHTGERPFQCPHCDYKASQKGLVDKHIMTKHTGEKPFKCSHCDFSSSHSSTVKTHVMFKHTGEKPYECPHCGYRAVQRGHIVRHIKAVHSGEKPFQCPHCDYKAGRNTNVKKHVMAVHSKEKPHHCPHCDFKSSHKGNLTSHMISKHTQMKPFVCQLCDYKSSCKTGLNKHLLKHNGIKKERLRCVYCKYSSDRKDHLRTHVTFVHFKGNKTLLMLNEMKTPAVEFSINEIGSDNNTNETAADTRHGRTRTCQTGPFSFDRNSSLPDVVSTSDSQ